MKLEIKKNIFIQFYKCIYGGVHWKPFIYNTSKYKEIGWLLWMFSYDDIRE